MTDKTLNTKVVNYCVKTYGFTQEDSIDYLLQAVKNLTTLSCKFYPTELDDCCTVLLREIGKVLNDFDEDTSEFINLIDALGYLPEMDIDQIRLVAEVLNFQDIGTAVLSVNQGAPDLYYLGENPREICEEKLGYTLDEDTLDTLDDYINWEEFMKDQLSGHVFFLEGMGWYQLID